MAITSSTNVQSPSSDIRASSAAALHPSFEQPKKSPYQNVKAYGPLMDLVFSVRYAGYSAKGYIETNASQRFMDEYDDAPNCTSYLMYYQTKLMGSIRSCVYSPERPWTIPAMEVFQKELENYVGLDNTVIEANKFVIHPSFQQRRGVKARASMYRNIIDSALEENAQSVVVAVRPAHVNFYRRFTPVSDVKSYPHLNFDTILLACHDIESIRDLIWNKSKE